MARAFDDRVEPFEHLQTGTRLGEGLGASGELAPAAKARTLAAVAAFTQTAREKDAVIACIATSAMRRARNADAFVADIFALTGARLEILDGPAEAAASFRGATMDAARDGARVAVVDIGGGSTECAVGHDEALEAAQSIEVGSVRLTERFVDLGGGAPGDAARRAAGAARAALRTDLQPFRALGNVQRMIAVAGTALTLGAISAGTSVTEVSGRVLTRATIDGLLERMLDLSLEGRRALPGMPAQRADVLVAGGLILSETLRCFGLETVVLEENDLLLGYLLTKHVG